MEDRNIGPIMQKLIDKEPRPNWTDISSATAFLKTLWRQWDRLELHANILYRRFDTGSDSIDQLVVPEKKVEQVLRFRHDIPTSGHLGVEKTLERIQQAFYWPNMTESVRLYCRQCDRCVSRKLSREANRAPMGQYMVGEPMERVAMDILGPLPVTGSGFRYVLVLVIVLPNGWNVSQS